MKATATVLLCFVVVCALAAGPGYDQEVVDFLQKCFNKYEIDERNVQTLPEIKKSCANACILKSLDMMNIDGTLNRENILTEHPNMSADKLDSFIDVCLDELSGKTFDEDEYPCAFVQCLQKYHFFRHLYKLNNNSTHYK